LLGTSGPVKAMMTIPATHRRNVHLQAQ